MSILNFKEIPQANTGEGDQDSFEVFARDFLQLLGYEIDEGPSRGADGGKDLIVSENMTGILYNTKIKWLVSCKHYAHSGKSVSAKDEIDITVRVEKFKCSGFMAFYSTLPSSRLQDTFSRLKDRINVEVFDGARIEHLLLNEGNLISVAARYFPQSFRNKRQLEIEYCYQREIMLYENEYKTKIDSAARLRDALGIVKARREYEQKTDLAQRKRDLDMKYLINGE